MFLSVSERRERLHWLLQNLCNCGRDVTEGRSLVDAWSVLLSAADFMIQPHRGWA